MCFSAEASFISAGALAVAGIAAVRLTTNPKQLPLACFPLVFSLQQFCEGLTWLKFNEELHGAREISADGLAVFIFLLVANAFWPFFAPFSAWIVEPKGIRKYLLGVLTLLGALLLGNNFIGLVVHPFSAAPTGHSIAYHFVVPWPSLNALCYLITTCALALSSFSWVAVLGYMILVSSVLSRALFSSSYVSSWCFFAALLSVIILVHFYNERRRQKI